MVFKLRMDGNRSKASRYIDAAKRKQEIIEKKIIDTWIDHNSNFDKQKSIDLWEKYRKEYGDKFTHEAIKTFAIANSIIDVNNILSGQLNMEDAGLDATFFNDLLGKMLLVNLNQIIVDGSSISDTIKSEIMLRIVAKQFPNKELKRTSSSPELITDIKRQVETYIGVNDEPVDDGH